MERSDLLESLKHIEASLSKSLADVTLILAHPKDVRTYLWGNGLRTLKHRHARRRFKAEMRLFVRGLM